MSPRQRRGLLVTLIGVLVAGLAFLAVADYTREVSRQVGPRQEVLQLSRDVPAYSPVTPADVEVVDIPTLYVSRSAVLSLDEVKGLVAGTALRTGSHLQTDDFVEAPAAGPGQRLIALVADIEASVAGSVGAGDLVDVIATTATGQEEPSARTVVTGLLVVRSALLGGPAPDAGGDTPDDAEEDGDGSAPTDASVTLAVTLVVTPQQAEEVVLADTVASSVRLALVPPQPGRPPSAAPDAAAGPDAAAAS